jgi:hypothetical protein
MSPLTLPPKEISLLPLRCLGLETLPPTLLVEHHPSHPAVG